MNCFCFLKKGRGAGHHGRSSDLVIYENKAPTWGEHFKCVLLKQCVSVCLCVCDMGREVGAFSVSAPTNEIIQAYDLH